MDKAKIDAMRELVDLIDKAVKRADSYGFGYVNTLHSAINTSTIRLAVDGLREMVDAAAAERARPAAVEGEDQAALRKALYALEDAARAAVADYRHDVRFEDANSNCVAVPHETVAVAVRVIKALLDVPPSPPNETKPAEPTLEECVAAMNRARHRGWSDWETGATAGDGSWLDVDEVLGLGRLLIDRERAEAAKGGA